jgi:SSS family solute:Na+ symporter
VVFAFWITDTLQLHFTIVAGLLTVLCIGLAIGSALAFDTQPTQEKIEGYTWANRTIEPTEALHWYKDYRWQSVAIVGLTAVMLVVFW